MSSNTPDNPSPEELSDYSTPKQGLFHVETKSLEMHTAGTRRGLAIASLVVFVVFYFLLLLLFAFKVITLQQLTGLIAAFSALPTLTAVAFAFYFAKS